ncbi:VanZ family protein [Sessilibacter sp. MAH2]
MLAVFLRSQFFVLIAFYLYIGVINVAGTPLASINDLFMHAAGYCVSVFSAFLAYGLLREFWKVVCLIWIFSVGVEIIQFVLPWRTFDWFDILANLGGLLVGFTIIQLTKPLFLPYLARLHAKAKSF